MKWYPNFRLELLASRRVTQLFDYLEGESGLAEFLEDFPHLHTQALQVLAAIVKAMLA